MEHCNHAMIYRYIGCEYGMVSVLKFDSEGRKIVHLPYCVPTNIIAGNCSIHTIWPSILFDFSLASKSFYVDIMPL